MDELSSLFNLDYPPPAYVGAVDTAPVILLSGNGGYNINMTPGEFSVPGSVEQAIERLHNPAKVNPEDVSPYYAARNYDEFLRSGKLTMANAGAYRSVNITPAIRKLTKHLPSALAHKKWLLEEAKPSSASGDRLIIAH